MQFTIQKFLLLIILILTTVLFSVFTHYYLNQKEKIARVILKSINTQISETGYTLSKSIKRKQDVASSRPLLDRVAANNDFVLAILIHDDQDVIVSTDPYHSSIISKDLLYTHESAAFEELMDKKAIEGDIRFYESDKAHVFKLLFILDEDEISLYFERSQLNFLLYFGLLPLLSLILILMLLRKYVARPLERLRQFAYYQNEIPESFKLKELEIIRYSMVQTFTRLENEKKELYAMARTDSLSGLANRNALHEYLERLIKSASRDNKEFAFLFLDLDHFKNINDSLGHNIGDELLKNVASIINEVLRSSDFVARVGGDEFVIVMQEYSSLMELTNVIDRIQKHLKKTWIIQTNPISIDSSVGIAFYPKDGDDMVSLMKHSDIAMYEAKQKGRAQYHFFTEELNKKVQDIIALNKDMRHALDNNEYELYYQPKVDVATQEIVGAEALIRWISPIKGIIAPDVFIPLAEENGFIVELGAWVVQNAIEQQKRFKEKGLDIVVSINVSSKQLLKDNFGKDFMSLLEQNSVSPSKIDIEITEYMFLQQSEKNYDILNKLHEYGVSISLDDFGTGYSSLSYLKEFPIDYLKIDKTFMDDYVTEKGSIFIETIVKMGQTLNMKVIAEGIELPEQVEYLKTIECNQYQGYFFSKPLCVEDFEKRYINKM